jgi:GxxExxY protein
MGLAMRMNAISGKIVDAAFHVHTELGPGLLERIYLAALKAEIRDRGLSLATEVPLPVTYKGEDLGLGCRADLIVEKTVLVEVKAVEKTAPVHLRQVLTYLRLARLPLGLLLNFGAPLIKEGITRVADTPSV